MEDGLICQKYGEDEYSFWVCCRGWENKEKIIIYSFGIGEDLSFSVQLATKWKQCEIYAFDPTPRSISYVDKFDKSIFRKFEFYPIGLSDKDYIANFYLPKNLEHVSGSEIINPVVDNRNIVKVQMHTLKYIMNMLGHNSIDLLKMDIEGSEFKVIPQILEENVGKIEQICMETHNRFYEDGEMKVKNILNILYKNQYKHIYTSENKEELTFVKY